MCNVQPGRRPHSWTLTASLDGNRQLQLPIDLSLVYRCHAYPALSTVAPNATHKTRLAPRPYISVSHSADLTVCRVNCVRASQDGKTTVLDRHQIRLRVRISSRVGLAVRFGSLSRRTALATSFSETNLI